MGTSRCLGPVSPNHNLWHFVKMLYVSSIFDAPCSQAHTNTYTKTRHTSENRTIRHIYSLHSRHSNLTFLKRSMMKFGWCHSIASGVTGKSEIAFYLFFILLLLPSPPSLFPLPFIPYLSQCHVWSLMFLYFKN